ncbi:MAG: ATP-binding cassette domain-containing protein, partial [Anaerolineales bacterium]|nr:ATP-binding cassette domain-containing protein [Anaerolineales bacterium]
MSDRDIALDVRNVTKRFPGVLANDQVNLTLRKGEIHALLGENGAGKSTLMNVIYGLYAPDEGQIFVNGEEVHIKDPNDAIAQGIGMVHQHFMLVPVFSVAENIMLGSEELKGPSLDVKTVADKIRKLSKAHNLEVNPNAIVEDLPVGIQQRVEIIKALYRDARILVLDEPTAVLTPQEADDLFVIMRQLTQQGVSIIFITHKLREVLAVADSITVMRRGKVVGTAKPQGLTESDLANMMVGREVTLRVEKTEAHPTNTVLEIENLTVRDERGIEAVRNLSLSVRAGEILGIAGVQGNGQTELAEALTGLRKIESGRVILDGQVVPDENPRYLFEHGMAHVPEDRHKHGLVLSYNLADNVALVTYYKPPYAKGVQRNDTAVLAAWRQIRAETQPDIVHIQHLMGLPLSIAADCQQNQIPYVVTLHDYWYGCANAQLFTNYDETVCAGPDRLFLNCGRCAGARAGVGQWVAPMFAPLLAYRQGRLRSVLAGATAVIAPTPFVAEVYAEMGFPAEKVVVLPHGLESPEPLPAKPRRDDFEVVYVGGIAPQKGVHVLLAACVGLPQVRLTV